MSHGRTLGDGAWSDREINVSRAVLLVSQVPLFLEDSKERSDSGRHRRLRKLVVNFRRGRVTVTVDDVHDLTFAATQVSGRYCHVGRWNWDKNLSLQIIF